MVYSYCWVALWQVMTCILCIIFYSFMISLLQLCLLGRRASNKVGEKIWLLILFLPFPGNFLYFSMTISGLNMLLRAWESNISNTSTIPFFSRKCKGLFAFHCIEKMRRYNPPRRWGLHGSAPYQWTSQLVGRTTLRPIAPACAQQWNIPRECYLPQSLLLWCLFSIKFTIVVSFLKSSVFEMI